MLKDQTEEQRFHSIFQQLRLCDRVKDGSGILFSQKKDIAYSLTAAYARNDFNGDFYADGTPKSKTKSKKF